MIQDQVKTRPVGAVFIMRAAAFQLGFEDVRSGRFPDFDHHGDDAWSYERGRLFACIAPVTMPLHIAGKLNPTAIALFKAAASRGYVL